MQMISICIPLFSADEIIKFYIKSNQNTFTLCLFEAEVAEFRRNKRQVRNEKGARGCFSIIVGGRL